MRCVKTENQYSDMEEGAVELYFHTLPEQLISLCCWWWPHEILRFVSITAVVAGWTVYRVMTMAPYQTMCILKAECEK